MRQATPREVDVLIVGCGPVGANAANLLGTYGVRVLVIDKAPDIFMAPRAIALDNEALRILQLAGLEDGAFETVAIDKVKMYSPTFGQYACAKTAGVLDGHPRLVTFYQPELERVLRERLKAYPHVELACAMEMTTFSENSRGISATLQDAEGKQSVVQTRFLVGADGAGSIVRKLLGENFSGKTFKQDWLIVDARNVPNPIDHVEFICDPNRPTPHMVAPGNRQRWEFMLQPGETREEMERPEKVQELLSRWGNANNMTIERMAVYRFHARIVKRFSRGKVFLVGDAAHVTPPFVGQGLVAGLRDTANLCWKLAWVVHGRASENILESYDMERRPHAKAIIGMALFMGRLVMPKNKIVAFFTHGLMRMLRALPFTRTIFEDLKFKPQNRFGKGLFVQGASGSRLVRGGLLPQGLVRQSAGAPILPSDDALGSNLSLIGFGCDPVPKLHPILHARWTKAGGDIIQIAHRGQKLNLNLRANLWEDMSETLVPGATPVGWVAVVRPDRAIVHDGPLADVNILIEQSLELLQGAAQSLDAEERTLSAAC